MINTYKILFRKLEGKKLLRTLRFRWNGNIKMYLKEIWREGVKWFYVIHDRDSGHERDDNDPLDFVKVWEYLIY
jgi:hypothetical protein